MATREFEYECCICGYHIHKEIRMELYPAFVNICEREALNPNERYAVAVMKNDIVISHLQRVLSQICSLFIARGGAITCVVSGT